MIFALFNVNPSCSITFISFATSIFNNYVAVTQINNTEAYGTKDLNPYT